MKAKKTTGIIISIVIILAIIICTIILILLMHGETKTAGENPSNVTSESLVCKSSSVDYPIFTYDHAKSKELKITANFYNDKVNALSLAYTLYYDNAEQIEASEAVNHADMNFSFANNGFDADYLNAHYSKMDDAMVMNLYATGKEITTTTAKYFVIKMEDQTSVPNTLAEYRKNYRAQGFNCEVNK